LNIEEQEDGFDRSHSATQKHPGIQNKPAPKDTIMEIFKTLIKQPYGMILITGPTGSGKSTTLYANFKNPKFP